MTLVASMVTKFAIAMTLIFSWQSCQAEQYAFLVGVRDYSLENELSSLKYAEDDVHRIATTLFNSGVPKENITLMTQRWATKQSARFAPRAEQIRTEFNLLLGELTAEDVIIVAFSGHGLQFKGDPVNYFCPLDASPRDKSTLVSLSEIYKALENSRAQTKLLLVDACRDDPLSKLSKSVRRIEIEQVSDRSPPVLAGGTVALFSCSATEQSFESPELESGVFFYFINKGLSGKADTDKDDIVDLGELESFSIKKVQSFVRLKYSKRQTPERIGSVKGVIQLVRVPAQSVSKTPSVRNDLTKSIKTGTDNTPSPPTKQPGIGSAGIGFPGLGSTRMGTAGFPGIGLGGSNIGPVQPVDHSDPKPDDAVDLLYQGSVWKGRVKYLEPLIGFVDVDYGNEQNREFSFKVTHRGADGKLTISLFGGRWSGKVVTGKITGGTVQLNFKAVSWDKGGQWNGRLSRNTLKLSRTVQRKKGSRRDFKENIEIRYQSPKR